MTRRGELAALAVWATLTLTCLAIWAGIAWITLR